MKNAFLKPLRYTNRWFAYFDLLGFSNLVKHHDIYMVIDIYNDVVKILTEQAEPKRSMGIHYSWFSDTFIIFTKSDSDKEFAVIEQAARLFFQRLILNKIPARGSLTIGPLYTQLKNNVFIGEAMIDACQYGEKQDWLGFVLTPSVYVRLKNGQLDLENRLHYRRVETPGIITHNNCGNVFAYTFNNSYGADGKSLYLRPLSEMMNESADLYKHKYQKTIDFITLHGRIMTTPG